MSHENHLSYDRMLKVFTASPIAMMVADREGKIILVNSLAEKTLRINSNSMIMRYHNDPGWRITDFEESDLPVDELPFNIVKRTGEPVYNIRHAVTLDNSDKLMLNVNVAPLFDTQGGFDGVVAVIENITHRVVSEKALADSEAMLKSVFRAAPVGIGVVKNRVLTWVNRKLLEMIGYAEADLLGKSSRVLYATREDFEYVGQEKYRQIGLCGTGSVETRWQRSDGCIIDVLLSSTPIDLDDLQRGVTFSALDITERREMERRLRHSEKMEAVGQLAGGVAHDFNNQLAGIVGYADLLKSERDDDPAVRSYTSGILGAARRAADLTTQLLAFARKGKYLSVTVDMHRIILEVVSLLKHSINKNIVIKQVFNANPSTTRGDPSQLQNAVLNLALNARDAMPGGGELTIETSVAQIVESQGRRMVFDVVPGTYLCIEIRDTGVGIDPEDQRRIFEPFYTTKEEGKGTGLGLAAVYGTMKNHHGGIKVVSEQEKGTVFTLFLPLQDGGASAVSATAGMAAEGAGLLNDRHIMVVDDEVHIRRMAAIMIESLGGRVTACRDGVEALDTYRRIGSEIDAVILDLVMPNMDGGAAFLALKELNPDIRVLVSSGYSIDGDAQQLLRAGAKDFIQKPFLKIELATRLCAVLQS